MFTEAPMPVLGPGAEMNFDDAVSTHSKWKHQLRDRLAKRDGSLNPHEVGADHKCELGEWIYGEAASYSSFPEYTKLKYEHARFHTVAMDLVKKANSGELIDEEIAPCSNSEFSTSSSALVMAIVAMKKRLTGSR